MSFLADMPLVPASALRRLEPEQRKQLAEWFVEEGLDTTEIRARCLKNFGRKFRLKTLDGHRAKLQQFLQTGKISSSKDAVNQALPSAKTVKNKTLAELLERLKSIAFAKSVESKAPPDLKIAAEFAKILIAAEREATQKLRFTLEREKWEFNTAEKCLQHFLGLQAIEKNSALDDTARVTAIRHLLFGDVLPH